MDFRLILAGKREIFPVGAKANQPCDQRRAAGNRECPERGRKRRLRVHPQEGIGAVDHAQPVETAERRAVDQCRQYGQSDRAPRQRRFGFEEQEGCERQKRTQQVQRQRGLLEQQLAIAVRAQRGNAFPFSSERS